MTRAVLLTLVIAYADANLRAEDRFTANRVRTFEYDATPPMRMPTDVAVSRKGAVAVADGVNDRVIRFAPDGVAIDVITTANQSPLSQPLSVVFDHRDWLWVVDTGARRLVALDHAGAAQAEIDLNAVGVRDPTDLAVSRTDSTLWIVDNDNHALIQMDGAGRRLRGVGSLGESLGRFHYPYAVALTADGAPLVTDVINGRVQRFTPDGIPAGDIGQYGVLPGNLYRPKGVAVAPDGLVWVSDSVLGVIQVFTETGRSLGLLRDEAGAPLKLSAPSGIAFNAEGDIFVAELIADRVSQYRVTRSQTPPDPKGAKPVSPGALAQSQPRQCTSCHFEWMRPLSEGKSTEIATLPLNPADNPAVSRDNVCLSCHDGAVDDSRRDVWIDHGHRSGVVPSMTVPPDLPLVEGEIVCRTCHSAHTRAGSDNFLRDAVFLRVEKEAHDLCMKCHFNGAADPIGAAHAAGLTVSPPPKPLLDAGAHFGHDNSQMTCMTCHKAHGSSQDALLVFSGDDDQLCLACHDDDFRQIPTQWRHPVAIPLADPTHVAAVHDMQARLGPENRMICLSCHAMHRAKERPLLVDSRSDGGICVRCHADQATLLGSRHDFRVSEIDTLNARGESIQQAGPCGACHAVHDGIGPALWTATIDPPTSPDDLCLNCHNADGLAKPAPFSPHSSMAVGSGRDVDGLPLFGADGSRLSDDHGDFGGLLSCGTCHDAHFAFKDRETGLRRGSPVDLCQSCHQETLSVALTGHGMISTADGASCLPCHDAHPPTLENELATVGQAMWVAAVAGEGVPDGSRQCLGCHVVGGIAAPVRQPDHILVPAGIPVPAGFARTGDGHDSNSDAGKSGSTSLVPITCRTCHTPHGPHRSNASFDLTFLAGATKPVQRAARPLLRPDAPKLCATCHGFDALRLHLNYHRHP